MHPDMGTYRRQKGEVDALKLELPAQLSAGGQALVSGGTTLLPTEQPVPDVTLIFFSYDVPRKSRPAEPGGRAI